MINFRSLAALLCTVALSACGKDAVQTIGAPPAGADIKFFNFGVNAPGVNFYANDTLKVTATSSTSCTPLPTDPALLAQCTTAGLESATGTAYTGVGNGGFYAALPPAAYAFKGKISAATDNGVAISTTTTTLADGKSYSLYLSGFYNATAKSVESFIVEDPIPTTIDDVFAYVRFVNASPNSSPLTLYAKGTVLGNVIEVPVGAAVSYKGAGAFVQLPGGIWDLNGRTTGSTANAVTRTAVSLNAGRVYTVTVFGDFTVTSSTATTRIRLDNTANR
jgi:hypothetical protein